MELWLLIAGAIVLIAIALWIVWPARTADAVGTTVQNEEVSRPDMTENVVPGMAPQGDRFEDQYTSATADLSAGGVATAIGSMEGASAGNTPSAASQPWSPPSASTDYSSSWQTPNEPTSLARPRNIGLGAGALLSIGGAIGGAWLYARWQRERNRPINRLRRGASDVANRLSERMPDVDDLPLTAVPMSGAATALLLTALIAGRALRRGSSDRPREVADQGGEVLRESLLEVLGRGRHAVERGRDATERGRKGSRRLAARLPMDKLPAPTETRKPAVMGIGFGGLAIVAGGAYLVWRVLRGSSPSTSWTASSGQ